MEICFAVAKSTVMIWTAAIITKAGGVFDTLTHPHLILLYSAYYGRLASHYGGPRCSPIHSSGAIRSIYRHMSRLSI